MKGLTKERAIELHRQLWNYIADESERKGQIITKEEAFIHFMWSPFVKAGCWCCEYDLQFGKWDCSHCPIKWPANRCVSSQSPFRHWRMVRNTDAVLIGNHKENLKEAIKYAREIANLPENPNV